MESEIVKVRRQAFRIDRDPEWEHPRVYRETKDGWEYIPRNEAALTAIQSKIYTSTKVFGDDEEEDENGGEE